MIELQDDEVGAQQRDARGFLLRGPVRLHGRCAQEQVQDQGLVFLPSDVCLVVSFCIGQFSLDYGVTMPIGSVTCVFDGIEIWPMYSSSKKANVDHFL